MLRKLWLLVPVLFVTSCLPYVYHMRDHRVLVRGIDLDATLEIARTELEETDFGVWHFAWAISNLYRNGDGTIKAELERAYLDARKRPERLTKFNDIASEHINGSKVYMGDFHAAARAFARSHIVAPGNEDYLQSLDQYKEKK